MANAENTGPTPAQGGGGWLRDAQTVSRQVQRLQRSSNSRNTGGGRPGANRPFGATMIVPSVLRVFQLDGVALEKEASQLLRTTLTHALSASFGSTFLYSYEDELDLGLSLVLFKFGFWDQNQHYGDKLQNVVYRSEHKATALGLGNILLSHADTRPTAVQKLLKLVLALLLPFAVNKLSKKAAEEDWSRMAENTWQHKVHLLLTWYEHAMAIGEFLNTLIFFRYGTYRSLVDRALGLRLVHGRQRMTRVVNLVFLTQQIYYNTLFSVMSYFLPLLNLGRIWRVISDMRFGMGGSSNTGGSASSAVGSPATAGGDRHFRSGSGIGGSLLDTKCPICSTDPMSMPRKTSCRHPVCYFCAASRTVDGAKFNCPTCGNSLGEADIGLQPPVVG